MRPWTAANVESTFGASELAIIQSSNIILRFN